MKLKHINLRGKFASPLLILFLLLHTLSCYSQENVYHIKLKDFYNDYNKTYKYYKINYKTQYYPVAFSILRGWKRQEIDSYIIQLKKNQDILIKSPVSSQIFFLFNKNLLKLKPSIVIEKDLNISQTFTTTTCEITTSQKDNKGNLISKETKMFPTKLVYTLRLNRIDRNGLTFYFPTNIDSIYLNEQVNNYMEVKKGLKELYNIKLTNPGILFTQDNYPNIQIIDEDAKSTFRHIISNNENFNIDVLGTHCHELTEGSLLSPEQIVYLGKDIRWIQDGLAELASYECVYKRRGDFSQILNRLDELKRSSQVKGKYFNLFDWDYGIIRDKKELKKSVIHYFDSEGYIISLYFWLKIKEKYGIEVIRKFYQSMLSRIENLHKNEDKIKFISSPYHEINKIPGKEFANILTEITKDDIVSILENMNIQEVIEYFEKIIPENEKNRWNEKRENATLQMPEFETEHLETGLKDNRIDYISKPMRLKDFIINKKSESIEFNFKIIDENNIPISGAYFIIIFRKTDGELVLFSNRSGEISFSLSKDFFKYFDPEIIIKSNRKCKVIT